MVNEEDFDRKNASQKEDEAFWESRKGVARQVKIQQEKDERRAEQWKENRKKKILKEKKKNRK